VGGTSQRTSRRLPLQPVLRTPARLGGRLSPTMRQVHVAGERMFLDYAGTKLELVDGTTGEVSACELFVAVLGASNYTYAEATYTQGLVDWIGSHVRAFTFYDGVAAQTVSDNLGSAISKACFYEPEVNRTYTETAVHYGTAVVPARPRKPRDKAPSGCAARCELFVRNEHR
jgi:transposase